MADYKLSYIITTFNKLPYLRQVLTRLIAARQPDEEIVVVDGGSKDGTVEWLREFYEAGQIQQFVSELDKGEAHGFNKGMLMARGEILKLITDDDAFDYSAIRAAKTFLLDHPELDVLTGQTGLLLVEDLRRATLYEDVEENFQRWYHHNESVWMIGLPLMIRRQSLPLTGLFHTGIVQVDGEFTHRVTSLKIGLAWSTALMSIRIDNPSSNSRLMKAGANFNAAVEEGTRVALMYDRKLAANFRGFNPPKESELLKKLVHWKEKGKRAVLDVLKLKMEHSPKNKPPAKEPIVLHTGYVPGADDDLIAAAFRVCDGLMAQYNQDHATEYLFRSHATTKVLQ